MQALGQYRKRKLIERYGADMRLPDLREEIAKCRRHEQTHDSCMVRCVDLVPDQRSGGFALSAEVKSQSSQGQKHDRRADTN
jgi:hypothetical protein